MACYILTAACRRTRQALHEFHVRARLNVLWRSERPVFDVAPLTRGVIGPLLQKQKPATILSRSTSNPTKSR